MTIARNLPGQTKIFKEGNSKWRGRDKILINNLKMITGHIDGILFKMSALHASDVKDHCFFYEDYSATRLSFTSTIHNS